MLGRAFELWKSEKRHKGTTLQRRLILFFASVTISFILVFALLLMLFGINGKGEKAARNYMATELSHVSNAISNNFGRLSLLGIDLSISISKSCDSFFTEQNISAEELSEHPERLELLISKQMPFLTTAMNSNTCSGVFLLLDATVNPEADHADTARAGFYLRATQSLPSQTVGAKKYCLRGPAQVARDNGIELLGQWKMEYDITGEDFFSLVMETARENETLPLSRLYYWTGRVTLHGNSEASFLLCVPLRSDNGTIFGVCGIEVSDRMFKQLYSPQESDYKDVFAIAAPSASDVLQSSQGLIAGNSFLTGQRMTEDLICTGQKSGFYRFCADASAYGGLTETVKLYPAGSPYSETKLSVAVLMPEELLNAVVKGNSAYLFIIVLILLVCSITASVFVSRRYLRPITKAFDSVKNKKQAEGAFHISEIDEFFETLAQQSKEQSEQIQRTQTEKQKAEEKYASAQKLIEQLSADKIKGFDPERYALFREGVGHLTKTQREIFLLYLEGYSLKDVRESRSYSTDALKWHNKEIYSKLGVSSLKELMTYAPVIKTDMERSTEH